MDTFHLYADVILKTQPFSQLFDDFSLKSVPQATTVVVEACFLIPQVAL